MLTTNLLPQEDKKTVRLIQIGRIAQLFGIFFISLAVVNIVFILPTYLPLFLTKRELSRELAIGKEAQEKFQVSLGTQEFRELTNTIRGIRTFVSKPPRTSEILTTLAESPTAQVAIETISIGSDGAIIVSGIASTRTSLLQYETALRNSQYFDSISSPLSNIVRETNIRFSIRANLKTEFIQHLSNTSRLYLAGSSFGILSGTFNTSSKGAEFIEPTPQKK